MTKTTKQKFQNIHPGEVLREEFLHPLGISQYRLAKELGVSEAHISAICSGKRTITADTANNRGQTTVCARRCDPATLCAWHH